MKENMNALYWIMLAVYSLALLYILSFFVWMILSALDDIRDRWESHKRRKEIEAYKRSREQFYKPHNPVNDPRDSEKSKKHINPKLLALSFLFGFLLGILLQSVIT